MLEEPFIRQHQIVLAIGKKLADDDSFGHIEAAFWIVDALRFEENVGAGPLFLPNNFAADSRDLDGGLEVHFSAFY